MSKDLLINLKGFFQIKSIVNLFIIKEKQNLLLKKKDFKIKKKKKQKNNSTHQYKTSQIISMSCYAFSRVPFQFDWAPIQNTSAFRYLIF